MNKNAALNFKEKKDFVLVQEVERRWSNSHATNNQIIDEVAGQLRENSSNNNKSSFQHQRTKSLCVFYNTSILNYARAANENKKNGSSSGKVSGAIKPRDVKILQNHEKIMEIQNKWTGNGRFIVREKNTFLVIF